MPLSIAAKLSVQFARFAAASSNAGSASLRNAFTNATAGSSSSASSSSWAQGLSSSGSASANGAGIGGAKYQAGRGAHSTFSQSGRAIANANASSHDGANTYGDDEEELALHQARIHRPGHLHRSGLLGAHISPRSSLQRRQTTTTLPALQLILPRGTQLLQGSAPSPRNQARTLSTSSTSHPSGARSSETIGELEGDKIAQLTDGKDAAYVVTKQESSVSRAPHLARRHVRSYSMSALSSGSERQRPDAVDVTIPLQKGHKGVKISSSRGQDVSRKTENSLDISNDTSIRNDPALLGIKKAVENGSPGRAIAAVQGFRQRKNYRPTLLGYNFALSALLRCKVQRRDIEIFVGTYLDIIEAGLTPDATTYTIMVSALCLRDLYQQGGYVNDGGQGVHDGQEFAQALSMFTLAHATYSGFTMVMPYNLMLRSCFIRGDVKQACSVLEHLSRHPELTPTSKTFALLIGCLNSDRQVIEGESQEDRHKRIMSACEQVLDEFEQRRSEGEVSASDSAPWNALIKVAFDQGNEHYAVRLAEMLLSGAKWREESLPAPSPSQITSSTLIVKFAQGGDFQAAFDWVDRLRKVNQSSSTSINHSAEDVLGAEDDLFSADEEALYGDLGGKNTDNESPFDGQRLMPMPSFKAMHNLIKLATNNPTPGSQLPDEKNVNDLLPRALRASELFLYLAESGNDTLLSSEHRISASALKRSLHLNISVLRQLKELKEDNAGSRLIDISMRMIHSFFASPFEFDTDLEVNPELVDAMGKNYEKLMPAVLGLLEEVIREGRLEDAASVFTYAVECQIRHAHIRQGREGDVVDFKRQLSAKCEALLGRQGLSENEASTVGHSVFVQNIETVIPAMDRVDIQVRSTEADCLLSDYKSIRQHLDPSSFALSAAGWNTLIGLVVAAESAVQFRRDDILSSFLADLATLPDFVRGELQLQDLIALAQTKQSAEVLSSLQKLGYTVPSDSESAPTATDDSGSQSATVSSPTTEGLDAASDGGATLTVDSLLNSYSPPEEVKQHLHQNLPEIQVIDQDFGEHLIQITRSSRMRNEVRKGNPEHAYSKMMSSILESGRYPSIEAVGAILDAAGRAGNLMRVHQLYDIGSRIVSVMGGDLQWQWWAWSTLENSMICGLAHAGEAKAASSHRHRLINAGRVPSVDAYGALIAVVRDTTDDALIAEELYEESRRLGVEPNVFLYNTVISKLCRARKSERAMALFNEMRQRGLRPSSVTYGSMMNGFTRTGDEESAEQIFEIMENAKNFRAKAPPYNTMIQFYTFTRINREKALHYYNKLQQHGVEPTAYTYKLLLDVHGQIEPVDIAGMEKIFGQLIADRNVNVDGNHWAAIISAHGVKAGNLSKAIEVFESISTHIASRQTAKTLDSRGRAPTGVSLPDAVVYEAMLNVFLAHGRTDLMQEYVERMCQSGIHATAYLANVMIKGLASTSSRLSSPSQSNEGTQDKTVDDATAAQGKSESGLLQARALFEEMNDPPMGVAAVGNHPVNHRHHANEATASHGTSFPLNDATGPQGAGSGSFGFQGVLREPSTFETMILAELAYGHTDEAQQLVERMKARGYPPALISKAQNLVNGSGEENQAIHD